MSVSLFCDCFTCSYCHLATLFRFCSINSRWKSELYPYRSSAGSPEPRGKCYWISYPASTVGSGLGCPNPASRGVQAADLAMTQLRASREPGERITVLFRETRRAVTAPHMGLVTRTEVWFHQHNFDRVRTHSVHDRELTFLDREV